MVKIFLEFSEFGRGYLRVWQKNSIQHIADSGCWTARQLNSETVKSGRFAIAAFLK